MIRSHRFTFSWVLGIGVSVLLFGTSCSLTNTIEKVFDFTSSTTPSGWYFPSKVQKQQKIVYFSRANFNRLKEDMASGRGKYLTSLATLMEVPPSQQEEFFALTKSHYHDLFPTEHVTPEAMLSNLSLAFSAAQGNRREVVSGKG